MCDHDRVWPLALITAMVFGACAVVIPVHGLNATPWGNPYMTSADYEQDIGFAVVTALICLGAALLFAIMATRMRARHRKRLAALRGDTAAMPLATIQPDPAQAPDVTTQPLELLWRITGLVTRAFAVFVILYALAALGMCAAILYFAIARIFVPSMLSQPLSSNDILVSVAAACALIAIIIGGSFYLGRLAPTFFGRPFGVRATADGAEGRSEYGFRTFIAWDEARLLEVLGLAENTQRRFALYAPGKSVTWSEYRVGFGSEYAPAGSTASEMALRQVALLNLIAARTGLEPRTLENSLRRDLIAIPRSARHPGALVYVAFALALASLATAEFLFPITPYAWANWPSVASLVILALFALASSVRTLIVRKRVSALAGPPAVRAPSLDASGVTYELTWRAPARWRATYATIGALLTVNLIPAAIVAPQAFSASTTATSALGVMWTIVVAALLGGMGVIGAFFALFGTQVATVRIRASADGVVKSVDGFENSAKLRPWSRILDIAWNARGAGDHPAYALHTDDPAEAISWPTAPRYLNPTPPRDGALPISPDALAALISAQIGQPIRTRD